jgi:hypothetical protein
MWNIRRNLIGCPKGKNQLGKLRHMKKVILKWISKKTSGMMSISFIGNVTGSGGGSCELCA